MGPSIPHKLRAIADPPKKVFALGQGDLDALTSQPCIAIVGSRKVDDYGRYVTTQLASELAELGIPIISGLALGVDALAHSAAVKAGAPTIAVLASGIGNITPRSNYQLAAAIAKNGYILSEHDGDYEPRKHDFLIRNRLISALADGVLIPQAAARSGSLNTARHALEQGKTVMAVPGPITNPLCEGTNNLIKMGATAVTCVDDILHALGIELVSKTDTDYELLAQNAAELAIIQKLGSGVSDADVLISECGLSPQECNVHLTMLELRGVIKPLGANQWTLGSS